MLSSTSGWRHEVVSSDPETLMQIGEYVDVEKYGAEILGWANYGTGMGTGTSMGIRAPPNSNKYEPTNWPQWISGILRRTCNAF